VGIPGTTSNFYPETMERNSRGQFIGGHKGIKNGGYFEKGMIPWNKGKHGVNGESPAWFPCGHIPWNKGKTNITKDKLIELYVKKKSTVREVMDYFHTGYPALCKYMEMWNISKESTSRYKRKCPEEIKRKFSLERRGELGRGWRGGVTHKNKIERHRAEYRKWRDSVYSRDDWTCQKCGARGAILVAHHLKAFAMVPEKRLDVHNGITLCEQCHKEYHKSFGQRKFIPVSFLTFLNLAVI